MIINLLPKPNELIEQSIMFNEALRGLGYRCTVRIPTNIEVPQLGYQQKVGYDDKLAFDAYISLEYPKPKLLQTLGWITDDPDSKPLVAYISRYIQSIDSPRDVNSDNYKELLPTRYTRITLEYNYNDIGKEFIVTDVSSNEFNPIYYIMKIVPYRQDVPSNPEPLQDENAQYLDFQNIDNEIIPAGTSRYKNTYIKL